MTVSILQTLATLPDGSVGAPLSLADFGAYVRREYDTEAEKRRNARHCRRDEFYCDGGVEYMKSIITDTHRDERVRKLRHQWVEHSRFNNALKRVINEMSTVYSQPSQRAVDGSEENQKRYADLLEALRMDEQMLHVSRLLNLHRTILVGLRVTQRADGERTAKIDIATPANVRAVLHPIDSSVVIGWLIKTDHRPVFLTPDTPAWMLWTDHEVVQFRSDLSIIESSYKEHGLGACPWIPLTLCPPRAGFWPGEEGEDLVAAHVAIWMNNVLMMKETKSATKVPVISGDSTTAARDQTFDSEGGVDVPDGVGINIIDTSMDLSMFRDGADHILASAGNNYGMPPSVMNHQGVQSADARDLMRIPIREIRLQQQKPLRVFERDFAIMMSKVLASEMPQLAFDPIGWRIDFGESQTPLSQLDALTLFEKMRAAGLDNSIAFLMRQNPDLTEEQAWNVVLENVRQELKRHEAMRPLLELNGAMNTPVDGEAKTPQQNGADGGNAAAEAADGDPDDPIDP